MTAEGKYIMNRSIWTDEPFNMDGSRYYEFEKAPVHFFAYSALDSSEAQWKVVFFHHPIYSSGKKHGPRLSLREALEPIFIRHGVDVVLSGHEHFYERIKPQNGVYYFISGAAARLRFGNIGPSELTAEGFDEDRSFLVVELAEHNLYFQAVRRTGETVDYGVLPRLD